MVTKTPSGKRHARPGRRRRKSKDGRPAKYGPSASANIPRKSLPNHLHRSRRSQTRPATSQTDHRHARKVNALIVAAIAGALIYLLRGPLALNATPGILQAMSIMVVPLALMTYWATRFARPAKAIAYYLSIIACTGLHAKFRVRDYLDTSIDFVVILQGLIFGAFIVSSALALNERGVRFKKMPLLLVAALLATSMLSNINALNVGYSAFSSVALVATLVFAAYCAATLSSSELATAVILSTAPIVVLSFVVYLFPGQAGEFIWTYDAQALARLRGIANNAIGLSLFSALMVIGLFFKTFLAERKEAGWIVISCLLIPVALICMWFSVSRGPAIGLFVALVLGSLLALRPFGKTTIPIFFITFTLMLPLFYLTVFEGLSNDDLSAFSRSGQAREVATLTGRTDIWAITTDLIADAPLIGHGMGSPLHLFADSRFTVVEGHNLFLHAALMIGIPGAIMLIVLAVTALGRAYSRRNAFALILLLFFIVTGITENYLFSNRPNWHTLIFFAVVLSVSRVRSGRAAPPGQKNQPGARPPAPAQHAGKSAGKTSGNTTGKTPANMPG